MENQKVRIKSLVNGIIGITSEDLRIKRTWNTKGSVKTVDLDDLRELIYEPGIEYMFREGILGIEDKDVRIELGLESETSTEDTPNMIIPDEKLMNRMLKVMPFAEFKETLKSIPREQIFEIVQYAIDNEIVDMKKCEVLKQITDIDIVSAIQLNKADKETVKEA